MYLESLGLMIIYEKLILQLNQFSTIPLPSFLTFF